MSLKKLQLTFLIALLPFGLVFAQKAALSKAEKFYEEGNWFEAVPFYERFLKNNPIPQAFERLGDCYSKLGEPRLAIDAYQKSASGEAPNPSAILKYGRALHYLGKYDLARDAYRRYKLTGQDATDVNRYLTALDNVSELKKDSSRFTVIAVPSLNSQFSEIMPFKYEDGIIFASNRSRKAFKGAVDLNTQEPTYDLYYSKRMGINFLEPELFKGILNTKYHDGPAYYYHPDSTLFFTRSNYMKGRYTASSSGLNHLVVFMTRKSDKKWEAPVLLPFNSDQYTTGHPVLSPNGDMIIFASNRPGGQGLSDLYMARREGALWTVPENLGPAINTDGDEYFPSFGLDGKLYYASDGIGGLGGLDIYSAEVKNGKFINPANLGYPMNSSGDDFGVYFDAEMGGGLFCSNRGSEFAINDNLYFFKVQSVISGTVVSTFQGEPVDSVLVEVTDDAGNTYTYYTKPDGTFEHICKPGREYQVKLKKQGWQDLEQMVSTKDLPLGEGLKVKFDFSPMLTNSVMGIVKDDDTHQPIEGAKVEVHREDGEVLEVMTGVDGSYNVKLEPGREYNIIVLKDGYIPEVRRINTDDLGPNGGFVFNAFLRKGDYVLVEGRVISLEQGLPMEGVGLSVLENRSGSEVKRMKSGRQGLFWISLPYDNLTDYSIMAHKKGYFTSRVDVEREGDGSKKAIIRMKLVEYGLEKIVKVIYYDYNSSALSAFSKRDLNEIYYFLEENPEATVELGSHTDSRGSKSYNLALSHRRSTSVVKYFVDIMGVDPSRITARGYGEEFLVNDCDDYKQCTEEGHSYNRRTEIKVVTLRPANNP